jgi:hypothetical protein
LNAEDLWGLLERVSATSAQASSAGRLKSDGDAEENPRRYNELLDKVLARAWRLVLHGTLLLLEEEES